MHGPQGLVWSNVNFFTGPQGSRAADARITALAPGVLDVRTTEPLPRQSGLTVAAIFPKGVVTAPSAVQLAEHVFDDNLPVFFSALGLVCAGYYVGWLFFYGAARPPAAIVPRFEPPADFSPPMVGYLEDKGMSDRDFSAGIVGLAVARHLKLTHEGGTYELVRQEGGQPVTSLEAGFESALFAGGDQLSISETHRDRVVAARTALENFLRGTMMPALLNRDARNPRTAVLIAMATVALTVAAMAISLGAFAGAMAFLLVFAILGAVLLVAAVTSGTRGRWILGLVGLVFLAVGLVIANATAFWVLIVSACLSATAGLAALSFRRLTVPTEEGWKRRDEIEGLKLFIGVAEADRLRVLNPPDFTPALYEKLLPYAIALGVEMVWSKRFAAAIAASQIDYRPSWYEGSHPWNRSDTTDFSSDLGGGLAGAVAAAASPPSSGDGSSGGGGDGGSGGGGGGGGGSGW